MSAGAPPTERTTGRDVRRLEDRRLITGAGEYVADVSRPNQVWARIVRSPVAHGAILGIELDEVRQMPGVVAAFAAGDAPELAAARIPLRLEAGEESPIPDWSLQPVIAGDRVRFVGEPVAVVVATDPYLAETAAERVWADIEEEAPILDALAALDGEVLLHPEVGTNVNVDLHFGDATDELDAIFARADVVVSERFYEHRHGGTPLETRGFVAEVGPDGRVTVWGAAKVKHFNRREVAKVLGLDVSQMRFLETDVGGGFGARGELYPEDYIIPWLAIRLQRPVKWIEDRAESLIALNQSREQYIDLEVAAAADGRLLAFRSRNVASLGAYMRTNGIVPPMLCAQSMHGPYRWQAFESHALGVLTNKTPLGTFRGPGEVEATFARERMLDMVAERLGIDPLDLRRRNLIPADAMPYLASIGDEDDDVLRFASGDYPAQLDALLEHVDWPTLTDAHATDDPDRQIGVALVCSTSESGVGQFEWARVVPEPDGMFTVYVGVASVGQGIATALTQVLADQLQIPMSRIRLTHHDTDKVEDGEGAFGDRGMIFGTGALLLALDALRGQAVAAAAERTGAAPEDIEVAGDAVVVDGERIPLHELAVSGTGRYEPGGLTHLSFCAAVAVVEVDVPTGKVTLLRYVGCYDSGTAVNPLMLEGQYTGAAAQGLGGALLEESAYDESGQPLSATFMDYIMPTAAELPAIESLQFEYPDPHTPLGIKGAGNSGIVCTHAAAASAVSNALRSYGAQVTSMPLRANSVRALIREAETVR